MLSLSQPSGFALSEDLLFIFCPWESHFYSAWSEL
jgi:hypothetical protein